MKQRVEKDALGAVKVAEDAWYGAATARALENFAVSGRRVDASLIIAYLRIKRAAALANFQNGVLDEERYEDILRAIDEIFLEAKQWDRLFPVDIYQAGAGTSLNMNINEVIANWANVRHGELRGQYQWIHPNDHVNRSQSTNDTFPTAMRLALLEQSEALVRSLTLLVDAFAHKELLWKDLLKAGRTHLQDAVPLSLGNEFSGYASALNRCLQGLLQSRESLREIGLGGTAVGTGANTPPGFAGTAVRELEKLTSEKLVPARNRFEFIQSQGPILQYSSSLRWIAVEVCRVCNDLRLLSSGPLTGLAELKLPAVQPGSSIMPGKVNPSVLEMANQACFSVLGHDQTVLHAEMSGQLELNVMMPIMANAALESTQVLSSALQILARKCISGIEPREEVLREYFLKTPQIATFLVPKLGYERVAELVRTAVDSRVPVLQLACQRGWIRQAEAEEIVRSAGMAAGVSRTPDFLRAATRK